MYHLRQNSAQSSKEEKDCQRCTNFENWRVYSGNWASQKKRQHNQTTHRVFFWKLRGECLGVLPESSEY
ncbi:hypothetical protein DMENIID0001_019650 [Sergentomyia squamirostris]